MTINDLLIGCDIPVPSDFSMGRHRPSHRRVGNVRNENGWEPIYPDHNFRPNNRLRNAEYEHYDYVFPFSTPVRHHSSLSRHIEETSKQVSSISSHKLFFRLDDKPL